MPDPSRSEEKEKRLEKAFAELREKRAKLPRERIGEVSPELRTFVGILPSDFDLEKVREEHIAWKHGERLDRTAERQGLEGSLEKVEDDDINGYKAYYAYMERKHR
jgi:hypothetical protein